MALPRKMIPGTQQVLPLYCLVSFISFLLPSSTHSIQYLFKATTTGDLYSLASSPTAPHALSLQKHHQTPAQPPVPLKSSSNTGLLTFAHAIVTRDYVIIPDAANQNVVVHKIGTQSLTSQALKVMCSVILSVLSPLLSFSLFSCPLCFPILLSVFCPFLFSQFSYPSLSFPLFLLSVCSSFSLFPYHNRTYSRQPRRPLEARLSCCPQAPPRIRFGALGGPTLLSCT